LRGTDFVDSVEIAGPGFLNVILRKTWTGDLIRRIFAEGENYGRGDLGQGRKVQVEFVSANPTGPLHLGHGRGAAIGDIAASVLEFAGWKVEREYYINDAGLQMELLGKSARGRYMELLGRGDEAPVPEEGYHGDYLVDAARTILEERPDLADLPEEEALPIFVERTSKLVLESIREDLERFGVRFDVWFSEKSLYQGDTFPKAMAVLKANGFAYDSEGAVWFRATAFGDEKDRVLIRGNGVPTYFASDIVYHKNKYDRGFDLVINVWGADHHGYIPRMKSAVQAMGRSPEDLQVILIQMVNLLRNGEPVAMSKRAGSFVTLREVVDEVGVDATRFFFLMRRSDSHLDFDLELAKKASSDNPVFYVQYAHARICSILRDLETRGEALPDPAAFDPEAVAAPEEQKLLTVLSRFPDEARKAAEELTPHRIAFYATDLAETFHGFYNACRILQAEESVRPSRLLLVAATRRVLRTALNLLGISAPERM
jgi:arginyl-tRNA synthetase